MVLIDRGSVPLIKKVLHAQEAGAAAALIVDTQGQCGEDFNCGGALGNRDDGHGFASSDGGREWQDVRIPVVMISRSQAARIARQMQLQTVELDGHGEQRYVP